MESTHELFTSGKFPEEAVYHAVMLEEVARMALLTIQLGNDNPVNQHLLDKHYNRKPGEDTYYGQK